MCRAQLVSSVGVPGGLESHRSTGRCPLNGGEARRRRYHSFSYEYVEGTRGVGPFHRQRHEHQASSVTLKNSSNPNLFDRTQQIQACTFAHVHRKIKSNDGNMWYIYQQRVGPASLLGPAGHRDCAALSCERFCSVRVATWNRNLPTPLSKYSEKHIGRSSLMFLQCLSRAHYELAAGLRAHVLRSRAGRTHLGPTSKGTEGAPHLCLFGLAPEGVHIGHVRRTTAPSLQHDWEVLAPAFLNPGLRTSKVCSLVSS